jgi:hypothetical protein
VRITVWQGGGGEVPAQTEDNQPVDHLLQLVCNNNTLSLDVKNPGWEGARGYLFDADSKTLYFPVSKKYLEGRDLDCYEVLILGPPSVVVTGRLSLATSDKDSGVQAELAARQNMEPAKASYMLFDQRYNRPRRNRYKLFIESMRETSNPAQTS